MAGYGTEAVVVVGVVGLEIVLGPRSRDGKVRIFQGPFDLHLLPSYDPFSHEVDCYQCWLYWIPIPRPIHGSKH